MSEEHEEEDVASAQSQSQMDDESRKMRPPNRKKFDEELDKMHNVIREKETDLEKLKAGGGLNISDKLKSLKSEKSDKITKRKQIDAELDKLNKDIPEKMRQLNQLESSLYYKSEEKINNAIQRLEWNLNHSSFKLSEEKRIVSEIDSLKRSKKTLAQYQILKQEISGIRDKQKRMRDERDRYFRSVSKLKSDEDRLRRNCSETKSGITYLKREIDELYEQKRQLVAAYKRQKEEFQGVRDKQRKESWKKKEEYRKSYNADKRKQQQAELDVEKPPYEGEINLCNTLINYLIRMSSLSIQEPSLDSLSPASSLDEPELAEEIDDGQYVLLKKSDEFEGLDYSGGARRSSKKNRRPRKQSSLKKVTLNPKVMEQFATLGLRAPSSMSEVAEAIDSLKMKKGCFEREQQPNEVSSDAGISATESLMCEMSRQASKTESCEGAVDTNPGEQVYADLLKGCPEGHTDLPEGFEEGGAVGGCDYHDASSRHSDSTVEGDSSGSSRSQSSVCENRKGGRAKPDLKNETGVNCILDLKEVRREMRFGGKSDTHQIHHEVKGTSSLPAQCSISQREKEKSVPTQSSDQKPYKDVLKRTPDFLKPHMGETRSQKDTDVKCADCRPKSKSPSPVTKTHQWGNVEKPASLFLSSSDAGTAQQNVPALSPVDFPFLKASSPSATSPSGNWPICNSQTDPARSVKGPSPLPSPTRPQQSHRTLAARLSAPSTSFSSQGQAQHISPTSVQSSQPPLILDSEDFPPLSQTMAPSRSSSLSTKSSAGSSVNQDHQAQSPAASSDQQQPSAPSLSNQISSLDISGSSQSTTGPLAQPSHASYSGGKLDSQISPNRAVPSPLSLQQPISVSQIPAVDKSSTEKWVESSVAFTKESVGAGETESTRL